MSEICLCPKCNGQGTVSKPPYVDGDVSEWVDNCCGGYTCKVCSGLGYLVIKSTVSP